jgi:GPI mannosyltransferase 3
MPGAPPSPGDASRAFGASHMTSVSIRRVRQILSQTLGSADGIDKPILFASRTGTADALHDLALVLILGAAIRLGVYLLLPNIVWPDEIYQVLEPAHRLVFGNGITPWEWQVGIRSWLFPGIVAALMWLGQGLGTDPFLVKLPIGLFMIAASCVPIACGYLWGQKLYGRWAGLLVGAVLAVWVDLVYLAAHTFNEVVAGDVFAAVVYLACSPRNRPAGAGLFLAGCLAGAAAALRFQLAPAVFVTALAGCGRRADRWRHYLAGASLPLLILGLVDWLTLGAPFQSVWLNVYLNFVRHVSDDYGRSPWYFYPDLFAAIWGAVFPLIVGLIVVGARRAPALLGVALAIVLAHSLVAHKEYRFVYPALPLLITLAALGTAELIRRVETPETIRGLCALAITMWTAASAFIGHSATFSVPWSRFRGAIDAFEMAATSPGLCGCAYYRTGVPGSLGASALPPGIPLYATDADELARDAAGFNLLVTPKGAPVSDPRFSRVGCFGGDFDPKGRPQLSFCLWRRPARCVPGIATPQQPTWPRSLGGTDFIR